MKINYKKAVLLLVLLLPKIVFAATADGNVLHADSNNSNIYTCTSKYQDKNIIVRDNAYFSHCMEAKCSNNAYKVYYYSPNSVTCINGNKSPFAQITKSGCNNLNACYGNQVKYCSIIIYYDCNRTVSGNKFTTTTTTTTKATTKKTTKKITNKKTTTKATTTTTAVKSNTKLKSIILSIGNIIFNPDVYEYNLSIESDVNSIDVTAIPEDTNSKVVVTNNTNLENGSVITIAVTGSDNTKSIYKIKIEKEEYIMSNNAKLSSLSIVEYKISFNPKINEYSVFLDSDKNTLSIDYETEDANATVNIEGNNNLSNGSKVIIKVTAEDGTENEYIINVTLKKKSNSVKIIFIIILILALGAGAYYVYKKFMQGKSSEKYEYE